MQKIKNKKIRMIGRNLIGVGLAVISLIFVFFIMALLIIGIIDFCGRNKIVKNDCLIEIAQDFCEQNGMKYDGIYSELFNPDLEFFCIRDRKVEPNNYIFYPEDIERCIN